MNAAASATPPGPLVIIVDDDVSMREALQSLFGSVGLQTEAFASTSALAERAPVDVETCLVLDVRLPGVSGLDFQSQLVASGRELPVVFMTGHGDIPMSVRAMKAGAVDFLSKPFRDQDMLDAVAAALDRDRRRRRERQELAALEARYAALTPREREVMVHVVAGLMNKQIAAEVGLSEITVKIHRGSLMRKMAARSVPDLVRMFEALRANPTREQI
ncbi:MAG: two-component system response regulator [Phenylobacterium sp.]|nr:two-component system response regulator [Phenylobacterium sp.]